MDMYDVIAVGVWTSMQQFPNTLVNSPDGPIESHLEMVTSILTTIRCDARFTGNLAETVARGILAMASLQLQNNREAQTVIAEGLRAWAVQDQEV